MNLKEKLLSALSGATSQNTVETAKLYPLGTRTQVEAALMQLYQAREIACCKIIKQGKERIVWWRIVWWSVGNIESGRYFGKARDKRR